MIIIIIIIIKAARCLRANVEKLRSRGIAGERRTQAPRSPCCSPLCVCLDDAKCLLRVDELSKKTTNQQII